MSTAPTGPLGSSLFPPLDTPVVDHFSSTTASNGRSSRVLSKMGTAGSELHRELFANVGERDFRRIIWPVLVGYQVFITESDKPKRVGKGMKERKRIHDLDTHLEDLCNFYKQEQRRASQGIDPDWSTLYDKAKTVVEDCTAYCSSNHKLRDGVLGPGKLNEQVCKLRDFAVKMQFESLKGAVDAARSTCGEVRTQFYRIRDALEVAKSDYRARFAEKKPARDALESARDAVDVLLAEDTGLSGALLNRDGVRYVLENDRSRHELAVALVLLFEANENCQGCEEPFWDAANERYLAALGQYGDLKKALGDAFVDSFVADFEGIVGAKNPHVGIEHFRNEVEQTEAMLSAAEAKLAQFDLTDYLRLDESYRKSYSSYQLVLARYERIVSECQVAENQCSSLYEDGLGVQLQYKSHLKGYANAKRTLAGQSPVLGAAYVKYLDAGDATAVAQIKSNQLFANGTREGVSEAEKAVVLGNHGDASEAHQRAALKEAHALQAYQELLNSYSEAS